MRKRCHRLLYMVFPRRCLYCDAVIAPEHAACENCREQIPYMEDPVCYYCGRSKTHCRCQAHRRLFDRCVAAMRYEGGAKATVVRLKHVDDADIVAGMADEMVKALRARTDAAAADVVTCVPMRREEIRRRGYNQSEHLAKAVASRLGLKFLPTLKKIYKTEPQKSLPRIKRGGNLLGAFDVITSVRGKRILLVDDLITSGSTLNECAKMLKIYGAEHVTALTFAATIPKEEENTQNGE